MDKYVNNFKSTADLTSNPGFQSTLSISSINEKNEKPYNPFDHRNLQHPNSTIGSILHLLKGCIGSGLLAMPAAFRNTGLAFGTICTLFAGYLCTHTIAILVRTSQQVCVDAKKPSMSFSETCGAAFTYGPKRLQSWGNFVKGVVDYSLLLAYSSTLCVYVVFISSSFKEVLDVLQPEWNLSIQMYCIIISIPLVLICQIRNLKYLVPFSAVANVMVVIVFAITMYYMFTDLPPVSDRVMVANPSTWPLFFSTVVFAMEGIGVVMPVENEMKKPQHFLRCPSVLYITMIAVTFLFTVFGFFGYLQFGEEVKGSVTLNLPDDELLAQITKLLMAMVIYFTYPLQCYVALEMIVRKLKKCESKFENLIQISIRTFLVLLSVAVAAAFPNLELVISFVGAIFFSTLGFLFPAIVETVYRWDRDRGPFNYIVYKNLIIGSFSLFILFSGAYTSAVRIIDEFFVKHPVENDNVTFASIENVLI
ncbi:LOW QUALITY PROTEIN: proton-coupled amino acid transporter-like protein pathetic [Leguminivora glycinivorella]|uniref:LOW QUALITY PROTEIN: proton-coupled amino acid transporter-like protein pathetic n=1 Tax=Leguminivora glycinivorella TaxID=1035111 RepID=UPI00200FD116|nr:LOW QUALITY PROTEIN: proton-coupled amino acid transporter-like protein pathetic [Leguminivora glycinivorella]